MNAEQVRKVITNPNETLKGKSQSVLIKLRNGSEITGVRKNEDTFFIQIMDQREKLHLLSKKDLQGVSLAPNSIMPSAALTQKAVDDIVAFLMTFNSTVGVEGEPKDISKLSAGSDFNVSFDRLRTPQKEPHNWLTYWGDYQGKHYSFLESITPANVAELTVQWVFSFGTGPGPIETTPLVVDGLMFATGAGNDAVALDAQSGRPIWRYHRALPNDIRRHCAIMTNRGLAVLGDRLYMATLDAFLVALDAKTGNLVWQVPVSDYQQGYSINHAPLAIDGKIIVGVSSGECALNGFVDAYDASNGNRLWRFWTIPQKGDPARGTWSGDSANFGGGPTWMTGVYDAETDTVYWTTGNPAPDYDGSVRHGDNLYTCSVLALAAETGRLKWYFQFTPHDTHDWDATEVPTLVDGAFAGRQRRLLIQANRNGFFYVLDRLTGEFLLGRPFVRQTWARQLDANGRPIVLPDTDPSPRGTYVCPDDGGATNWNSPSYDPRRQLYYVSVRETCATYTSETVLPRPGLAYMGGGAELDPELGQPGAIRAIDPASGEIRWSFRLHLGSYSAGILATGGGVVLAGTKEGYLVALDARTGDELWHFQTGSEIRSSPISYAIDGRQFIEIATTSTLFTFALPVRKLPAGPRVAATK
jgi:alcohol dehydrogenase (cytochrome c)